MPFSVVIIAPFIAERSFSSDKSYSSKWKVTFFKTQNILIALESVKIELK
jgi:hypothetical protein